MLQIIIPVLFLLFVLSILGTMAWAGISAAPFVPIRKKDVMRILKLADVKPKELVYDLGAGDGRIVIAAARDFKTKAVGFEISILPYLITRLRVMLNRQLNNVSIKAKNFYKKDLSDADVITTFLMPKAMKKLEPKFARELKPGARLVSYTFPLPNKKPYKIDKPTLKSVAIYLYRY